MPSAAQHEDVTHCLTIISVNAGGKGGDDEGITSIIAAANRAAAWNVLFVSELDAHLSHEHKVELEGFCIWRHWPGQGSHAMAFIVPACLQSCASRPVWLGRCGVLRILSSVYSREALWVFGIHGAHGELLDQSLLDADTLAANKPRASSCLFVGDWNVDYLPTLMMDPWCNVPHRSHHHSERRMSLESWADASNLQLFLPSMVVGLPGGHFNEFALACQFSRVPEGVQSHIPSLLDFAVASRSVVKSCELDWENSMSDHALLVVTAACVFKKPFPRTHWRCMDVEACILVFKCQPVFQGNDQPSFEVFCERVRKVQDSLHDSRPKKVRAFERMPFELRDVLSRLRTTADQAEASLLKSRAWILKKKWVRDMKIHAMKKQSDRGGVFVKSSRLHAVSRLAIPNEDDTLTQWSCNEDEWEYPVYEYFNTKVGAYDDAQCSRLDAFLNNLDGLTPKVTPESIEAACARCNNTSKLDQYGVCVDALLALFTADPAAFCNWFAQTVASTSTMSRITVKACALGKTSCNSQLGELRVIAPLCAFLQIVDAWGAAIVHDIVDKVLPMQPGLFVAARPKTQMRDIGHSLSLLVEKALDDKSQFALAQADVEKHYDTVNVFLVASWLLRQGADASQVAACVRHQLLTSLEIRISTVHIVLTRRCLGTLTGSRLAGALGRIPVEESMHAIFDAAAHCAYPCDHIRLVASCYVDNTYFPARHVSSAISNANLFETHLRQTWDQRIKPSSKSVLACVGCDEELEEHFDWSVSTTDQVLGWTFYSNGSFADAWVQVRGKLWRAYHSQFRRPGTAQVGFCRKIAVLDRVVARVLLRAVEPWPFSRSMASQIDALQKHMVACLLRLPKNPGEAVKDYMRRRARFAGSVIGTPWSELWARNVVSWDAHLLRDWGVQKRFYHDGAPHLILPTSWSWAPVLRQFHDNEWLSQRRTLRHKGNGDLSTRTRLRAAVGGVAARWEAGVQAASVKAPLQQS